MKGPLGVALAARGYRDGRAVRSALYRHRRLEDEPLVIVLWQLGGEPFGASAIAWGSRREGMEMRVAGDPRNASLAFAALLDLARWFNPRFEAHGARREVLVSKRTGRERQRARSAPQVIVANRATVEFMGRLGRRLAYLSTDGDRAADPALVQLGRHFQFLASHAGMAGQQLILPLDTLVQDHWVTPQSPLERASLAALDAYIEPPRGLHGFAAAAAVESSPVGPIPGADDDRLQPLVEEFNRHRRDLTEDAVIAPLLAPIARHYRPLLEATWRVVWRVWTRERGFEEAPSAGRRWEVDRDEFTRHLDLVAGGFRRRARETPKQAAERLRRLESAHKLLETEEACDDPVRMIPYLLEHKALIGRVVEIDLEHRELATKKMVVRPLVTLLLDHPCLMPAGKELYWSKNPRGPEFEVVRVDKDRVVLKCASPTAGKYPVRGSRACFSVLNCKEFYPPALPKQPPWSHSRGDASGRTDIEETPA